MLKILYYKFHYIYMTIFISLMALFYQDSCICPLRSERSEEMRKFLFR